MNSRHKTHRKRQQGAVLIITLILMLIAAFVVVYMVSGTGQDLRMARNTQDATRSFEWAEAGIQAVLSSSAGAANTAADPLRVTNGPANPANPTPANAWDFLPAAPADPNVPDPLAPLRDGTAGVTAEVALTMSNTTCPPSAAEEASSNDLISCDHYSICSRQWSRRLGSNDLISSDHCSITAAHNQANIARTQVVQGVMRKRPRAN